MIQPLYYDRATNELKVVDFQQYGASPIITSIGLEEMKLMYEPDRPGVPACAPLSEYLRRTLQQATEPTIFVSQQTTHPQREINPADLRIAIVELDEKVAKQDKKLKEHAQQFETVAGQLSAMSLKVENMLETCRAYEVGMYKEMRKRLAAIKTIADLDSELQKLDQEISNYERKYPTPNGPSAG